MSDKSIVVANWKTWESYLHHKENNDPSVIYTACPGVFESISDKYTVFDISKSITISEANRLGEDILIVSDKWKRVISRYYKDKISYFDMGEVLGRNLPMIMNALVYHYNLLALQAKSTNKVLYVPYLEDGINDVLYSQRQVLQKSQINWFGLIAQSKKLTNVESIPVTKLSKTTYRKPQSVFQILSSLIIKLSGSNLFVCSKILLFQKYVNKLYNNIWAKNDKQVLFFLTNDLVFSMMPRFIRRKVNLSPVKLPKLEQHTKYEEQSHKLRDELMREVINKGYEVPLEIAADCIESYINCTLLPASSVFQNKVKDILSKSKCNKFVFLTNSLGGSLESIFAYAFRGEGVPIISSQHGAIGLLKQYEVWQQYSSMVRCDYFVCFNSYEKDFFLRFVKDKLSKFYVQGIQNAYRGRFKSVVRYIIRRQWRVPFNKKLVLYLPTRFKEGQVLPYDNYDMKYWLFMKKIVFDVFEKNNACNVIKVHQKGITIHNQKNEYRNRKNPWLSIDLPNNIFIRSYPQFDYSRYAADILIIDRATSTLGWALASNIPLIYIDSHHSPLVPNIKKKISKVVFLVDAYEVNWKEKLLEYTSMDKQLMINEWQLMKQERDKFIVNYVLGDGTSNFSNVVDWVLTRKVI